MSMTRRSQVSGIIGEHLSDGVGAPSLGCSSGLEFRIHRV